MTEHIFVSSNKIDAIFINSENDKLHYHVYQVLVFTMHRKVYKSHLKLIKLRKNGTTWHDELPERLYSIAHTKKIYIIQRKTSNN